jgi:hypothetical protein
MYRTEENKIYRTEENTKYRTEENRMYRTEKQNIHSSPLHPSVFSLVGSFPSGIVASHSFHCCITVSCCVSGDLLQAL